MVDREIHEPKKLHTAKKKEKKEILSRSKYAILKPEERLTEVQKVKLDEVTQNFPLLAKMHQQKEAFRDIFEKSENWVDGTFSFLDWIGDASETFEKSVGTIQCWMSEIIGYFDYGTTSGAVEGINNRLKLIRPRLEASFGHSGFSSQFQLTSH